MWFITTSIVVERMSRRLERKTGNYALGRRETVRGRCREGSIIGASLLGFSIGLFVKLF
jgi:hypothetical protein